MQNAQLNAADWLRQNHVVFNTFKSNIVIFGRPNNTNYNNVNLHIDNTSISQPDSAKLLGLVIYGRIMSYFEKNISPKLGLLRRIRPVILNDSLKIYFINSEHHRLLYFCVGQLWHF